MKSNSEQNFTCELIEIARRAYDRYLTAAAGGNISARADKNHFLVSRSGSSFGFLTPEDILTVRLDEEVVGGHGKPSSEMPVHAAIYRELTERAVVHTHPPLISALALTDTPLTPLIFEHYVVLGDVPVIPQSGPNITDVAPIVESLKNNKIVILRHHGVIAVGDSLEEAFLLTDLLETSAKTIIAVRSQGPEKPLPGMFSKDPIKLDKYIELFSEDHVGSVTERVNRDKDMAALGKKHDFTTTICIRTTDTEKTWVLGIKKGAIKKRSPAGKEQQSTFTFFATQDVWTRIFTGRTNVIVGIYQGRVKMEGDVRKLSHWYMPMQCLFECFKMQQKI